MKSRVISVAVAFIIVFSSLSVRIAYIGNKTAAAGAVNSVRNRDIGFTRGKLYDTNFVPLTGVASHKKAIIKPTPAAIAAIKKLPDSAAMTEKLKRGELVITEIDDARLIKECEDIKILTVFDRYEETVGEHIVGYINAENKGVYALEKYCEEFLTANSGNLSVSYHTDALGRVLNSEPIEIRDENYNSSAGIVTTLDIVIQKIVENALRNNKIDEGAAVVLDVKTGEILAAASCPEFSCNDISSALNNEAAPFINRAFTAFSIGSVFKVVTAAAALENGINLQTYNCDGKITKSGNTFFCSRRDGHGTMDIKKAFAVSCNPYFIELGVEVGAQKLVATASKLGIGKETKLYGDYTSDPGILPELKTLNSDAAVGNIGFGQGELTATPLQMASVYATIANGGIYNEPKLIKGTLKADKSFEEATKTQPIRVLKDSTCSTIKDCLLEVNKDGTGQGADSWLFLSCGKTATAQSGQFDKNGVEITHTWYCGFFPYESPQYAVCILKENGTSGSSDDAPIFKEISENIFILNRTR